MGLENSYNIGKIILHPNNPEIAYVAAIGNLYGAVGDRGFYKTENGGRTWTKLAGGLPGGEWNGAIDAAIHPNNPNTLYVTFWERKRYPWALESGGPNGGIFKSTDAGRTWRKLTQGLPVGDNGKIGIAISRSNPNVLMAHYEHGFQPAQNSPDFADMTKPSAR
jgi:photosystem II stability/assembly factor-like uncharacterized protein